MATESHFKLVAVSFDSFTVLTYYGVGQFLEKKDPGNRWAIIIGCYYPQALAVDQDGKYNVLIYLLLYHIY